jgi:hypothetical protein
MTRTPIVTRQTNKRGLNSDPPSLDMDSDSDNDRQPPSLEEIEQDKAAHQQRMKAAVNEYAAELEKVRPEKVSSHFVAGLLLAFPGLNFPSHHHRNIKKIQKKAVTIDADPAPAADSHDGQSNGDKSVKSYSSNGDTNSFVIAAANGIAIPAKKKRNKGDRKKGQTKKKLKKLSQDTANAVTRVCFLYKQAQDESNRVRMPKGLLNDIIEQVRTEFKLDYSFAVPPATVTIEFDRSNAKEQYAYRRCWKLRTGSAILSCRQHPVVTHSRRMNSSRSPSR